MRIIFVPLKEKYNASPLRGSGGDFPPVQKTSLQSDTIYTKMVLKDKTMDRNHYYNKNLLEKARELRKYSTKAERIIWNDLLRKRQTCGYKFLRQRSIGPFIVDFYCKELRLIIEIDGFTHQMEGAAKEDEIREKYLCALGNQMIRFTDNQVLCELENVRLILEKWIKEWEEFKG
jgi:very-short-patch-repair endonuclease